MRQVQSLLYPHQGCQLLRHFALFTKPAKTRVCVAARMCACLCDDVWFLSISLIHASVVFPSLYSHLKEVRAFCLIVIKFILILLTFWNLAWLEVTRPGQRNKLLVEFSAVTLKNHCAFLHLCWEKK